MSSLERDGRPVFRDLRWGVYVVLEAPNDMPPTASGQYGRRPTPADAMRRCTNHHLIGLELNISVLSAALRKGTDGAAYGFRGDVAAVAKRTCAPARCSTARHYTVWGKLMPARRA